MSGESKTTTNHDTIQQWVESRGGKPAVVEGTESEGQGIGLLRIEFPGQGSDDSLKPISWDEFFTTFEQKNLAFLYQDSVKSGKESRFFKFINRD